MENIKLVKLTGRGVTAAAGFQAAGIAGGIKNNKKDLALICSDTDAIAAGVFTQNLVQAAPVRQCKENLEKPIRAILVNSGNANACTGEQGERDARAMAAQMAAALDIADGGVLICSTGVIGEPLPMERVKSGIEQLPVALAAGEEADLNAAEAIMTTDTRVKMSAYSVSLPEGEFAIGGMAKGSGMICPNMATMLAFITTDVKIERPLLQKMFSEAADRSFNVITVDGDTSTNDTALILANGAAGKVEVTEGNHFYQPFKEALELVCRELALQIVEDGEGLTKLITLKIVNAADEAGARIMARTILNSPLVKTAFYGEDANWGRIIAALGYAGIDFNPELVDIFIGPYQVAEKGGAVPFSEEKMKTVLQKRDIEVVIDLKFGSAAVTAWGTDLSHEYININADYRS